MRLFVTGGTGFIGTWLLETLCHAREQLDLSIEVTVLTRSVERFTKASPHLVAKPYLHVLEGDIRSIKIPDGDFTHLIHGATDASASLNGSDPLAMFDTIVSGTRWALEFAREKSIRRSLFLSSGAVYGRQPWSLTHLPEDWHGGPDVNTAQSSYAEGKRAAEQLCAIYRQQYGVDYVTARIFAVLGPGLPLDAHFAAGNFLRDLLKGNKISISGNGEAVRSYLYTSDLTVWLWTMLAKAENGDCFNVGSTQCVTIAELAYKMNHLLNGCGVEVLCAADHGWNPGRYVPSVEHIKNKLKLKESINIDEAIQRMSIYYESI